MPHIGGGSGDGSRTHKTLLSVDFESTMFTSFITPLYTNRLYSSNLYQSSSDHEDFERR